MEKEIPKIHLTETAARQIALMKQCDYTLTNKFFRLQIVGKGCDGFTYGTSFTEKREDDHFILQKFDDQIIEILIDPFCAFYFTEGSIDFLQHDVDGVFEEGFVINNFNQDKFQYKFWKNAPELIPSV